MESGKNKIGNTDRINILRFFLDLFRVQSGSSYKDEGEFSASSDRPANLTSSYKLQVKQYGKWKSRRITVTPLGDSSGSKSKCFKVIYDDFIVVKIPPTPVRSFFQYIESIKEEKKIVSLLQPDIECIVPTVSSILKKIPPFTEFSHLDPSTFEERCIDKLKKNPELQRFLKIGDTFVYFMNMSKYSFLSTVLEKMHDMNETVQREIMRHGDVLWDLMIFEEQFGESFSHVFFNINKVYTVYEEKIHLLVNRYGAYPAIPNYQIKEWFLNHLAEKSVKPEDHPVYPPGFIEDLPILFDKISEKYRRDVKAYLRMVKQFIKSRSFNRNKAKMGGVISNILKLLARLQERGVAIRDLKPENVFVVGDPESHPLLLANTDQYSIGLIDFETAVGFDRKYDNKIKQPLLAGTPSYATPSHLFENELLMDVYDDLGRIFHFQDWQAAIGMVYNVITGERLAEKTSRVLPQTMKIMRQSLENKRPMMEVFKKSNRMFWNRAVKELDEKLSFHETMMKNVHAPIPPEFATLLLDEIRIQRGDIRKKMKRLIASQRFFKSPDARRNLFESSAETINNYIEKWEKNVNVPKASPKARDLIITFLKNLKQTKLENELFARAQKSVNVEDPRLSVYSLIEIMFHIIYRNMYKTEWEAHFEISRIERAPENSEDDTPPSDAAAVMYERTLVSDVIGAVRS